MPTLYLSDGTAYNKIKKLYYSDGTANYELKELYESDGTAWYQIFSGYKAVLLSAPSFYQNSGGYANDKWSLDDNQSTYVINTDGISCTVKIEASSLHPNRAWFGAEMYLDLGESKSIYGLKLNQSIVANYVDDSYFIDPESLSIRINIAPAFYVDLYHSLNSTKDSSSNTFTFEPNVATALDSLQQSQYVYLIIEAYVAKDRYGNKSSFSINIPNNALSILVNTDGSQEIPIIFN